MMIGFKIYLTYMCIEYVSTEINTFSFSSNIIKLLATGQIDQFANVRHYLECHCPEKKHNIFELQEQ